ncbi:MAG: glycosyltransferase family 4 protein [Armatimonadetes bacterium]|nr:glycosyltransferase family 4 protein [Armatimonadota bacterium]
MSGSALQLVRPAGGGLRRHVALLAKYLPEEGFSPIIVGPAMLFEKDEIPEEVARYEVPFQAGWGPRDLKTAASLIGLSRKIRPAVLHMHGYRSLWIGALAARRLKPAVMVATIHTLLPGSPGRAKRGVLRWALRQYDRIIAVSDAVRQDCLRLGAHPERIVLIYNGVELRGGRSESGIPLLPESRVGEIILCAARLSPEKGVGVLLRSLPLMEKGYLWIAGEGRERAGLEREVREMGIGNRVSFLGFRPDVADLMSAADIVVCPSLMDGCPLAVWEAMAAGKAVVASAVGGIPEMIDHEHTGLLVEADDPRALADGLNRMISDREFRESVGRRGQEWVLKERTARKMAAETALLYRQHLAAIRGR